ncbi:UvrD-helicase domain-containing protein [Cupriavidus pauculus]|uniref:UvrD-helicase domain-containing protein n=1 Tax=Cupriavidus pauculus TaxID=82633 RepID=UPI001FD30927|nr:UvrD-helicase domain-containing protein [Cupriavidus pauculus]
MADIDLLSIDRGTVTAPAGCGKTQLIADSLKAHLDAKPVLILTHTNAGKHALEVRLKKAGVPKYAYRLATIDSWSIRLISKFPGRSGHRPEVLMLENPATDYPAIRQAAWNLLASEDISDVVRSTYSHLIVDEYQDCSIPQHNIIGWIAHVLPTCVLGDPMQAIFDFREPTVDWAKDVHQMFPPVGQLAIPWRWRNAGTEALGNWLLDARHLLLTGQAINLLSAPAEVEWKQLPANANAAHELRLQAARTQAAGGHATVLVIGDSKSPPGQRLMAANTPGATTVEAVDLQDLTAFGRSFDPKAPDALQRLVRFAAEMMTNLGAAELLRRVDSLTKGTAHKDASEAESAALGFQTGPSFASASNAMQAFVDAPNVHVYRPETLHVCQTALLIAAKGECTFPQAVTQARERNRHLGRPAMRRAVGSTLLLKGLEADVAVVLNPSAMNARHLYVALTRGAKHLVVCSESPVLMPVP